MWETHSLNLVVWLGHNGVWPTHTTKKDGQDHLCFVYAEKPKKLVDEYFLTGNQVRRILNIYGRVRRNMHEAANHGGQQTPFEIPVM